VKDEREGYQRSNASNASGRLKKAEVNRSGVCASDIGMNANFVITAGDPMTPVGVKLGTLNLGLVPLPVLD
jgi:hypothetical protein